MTPQKALEKIGNTVTQVFDLPIKTLCKTEYKALEQGLNKLTRIANELNKWHECANDNVKNAFTCIAKIEEIIKE